MNTDGPVVQDFMTAQPYWIHAGASLEQARTLMAEHDIRHLPVMNFLTVMGMISERDLNLALGLEGTNPARLVVMDMCHGHPYIVAPHSRLRDVAAEMADRGIGSAIVMDGVRLVGIFTTVDACRALAAVLTPLQPCRADDWG